MQKIPTLFTRDFTHNPRYVTRAVTPGCEWVLQGKGTPTRKYDGTCVMVDEDGDWRARREVKPGQEAPPGFTAVTHDDETGKTIGWVPARQSSFAKYLTEAAAGPYRWKTGTYELLGPKINGNPEGFETHVLLRHENAEVLDGVPHDYDGLAAWLLTHPYEGIVWHGGPDGAMAKIKKRDFPS